MARFCTNCGKEIADGANACSNCGAMMNAGAGATQATTATQPTVVVNNVQTAKGNGMAKAGLICSIVSTILCCGSFNWLSLIFSIIGLVQADSRGEGKGASIAGLIISIAGIILAIIFVTFILPLIVVAIEAGSF